MSTWTWDGWGASSVKRLHCLALSTVDIPSPSYLILSFL